MKAQKLIALSFRDIGKLAAEQDITPPMYQDAIDTLNVLMYENAYLNLGYTEVVSASDDITTPNFSWRWMRYALALDLAPEYGTLDSYMLLDEKMDKAMDVVLLSTVSIPPPTLNGNVPYGSGNRSASCGTRRFYPESDDAVLSEQNQIIVTEGS